MIVDGLRVLSDVVRANRVFATVPGGVLTRVMLLLRPMIAAAGDSVCKEATPGTTMFMVLSGELRASHAQEGRWHCRMAQAFIAHVGAAHGAG